MRVVVLEDVRTFQPVRQHQFLVVEQVQSVAVGNHFTPVEHDDAGTEFDDQLQVVRGNDLGGAAG